MTLPEPVYERQHALFSRRTICQFHFLRPDPAAANLHRYVLGLALANVEHRLELNAAVLMSNHTHEVAFDLQADRSEFLAHKNGLMARGFNALRQRKGRLFDAPSRRNKEPLLEAAGILSAVVYTLCNPVAANLCDWPHEWPGSVGDWRQILTVPVSALRPTGFFNQGDPTQGARPRSVSFQLAKPKCFASLEKHDYEALIRDAVRAECLRLHALRTFPPLGVERALALPVTHQPAQLDKELEHEPTRFVGDPALVQRLLQEWIAFVAAYLQARHRWTRGERVGVLFPPGTDAYRRLEQAPTAPLDPDSAYAAFHT